MVRPIVAMVVVAVHGPLRAQSSYVHVAVFALSCCPIYPIYEYQVMVWALHAALVKDFREAISGYLLCVGESFIVPATTLVRV